MTGQQHENFVCESVRYDISEEPLEDYFAVRGSKPVFNWLSSGCWRGYVGTWALTNQRLYLIALRPAVGFEEDHDTRLSLAMLFPNYPKRVFAHWYSGTMRVSVDRKFDYLPDEYWEKLESLVSLSVIPRALDRTLRLNWWKGVLRSACFESECGRHVERFVELDEACELLSTANKTEPHNP